MCAMVFKQNIFPTPDTIFSNVGICQMQNRNGATIIRTQTPPLRPQSTCMNAGCLAVDMVRVLGSWKGRGGGVGGSEGGRTERSATILLCGYRLSFGSRAGMLLLRNVYSYRWDIMILHILIKSFIWRWIKLPEDNFVENMCLIRFSFWNGNGGKGGGGLLRMCLYLVYLPRICSGGSFNMRVYCAYIYMYCRLFEHLRCGYIWYELVIVLHHYMENIRLPININIIKNICATCDDFCWLFQLICLCVPWH